MASSIFPSSGNLPVAFLEYSSVPPTVSSKQPPFEGISSYREIACLNRGRIFAVKLTACGS